MAENLYLWSTTASSNDLADAGINWQEGQVPGSVNSSARSMMATLAKFRSDTNGTLTTTNVGNAYSIASPNTNYTALVNGIIIGFRANATNTSLATFNLQSIGSKPINKFVGGAEVGIETGDIAATGHYLLQYDSSLGGGGGAWILLNPSESQAAWLLFTPVVTSSVGIIGSLAFQQIFWRQIQKVVFIRGNIGISAQGTASGTLSATLPVTPVTNLAGSQIIVGREAGITGKMVSGTIPSGTASVGLLFYDNTTCIATGNVVMFSGTYEAA